MDFSVISLQVFILFKFIENANCESPIFVFTSQIISKTVVITNTDVRQTVTKTFTKYIKTEDAIINTYSITESTNRQQCLVHCNKDPGCMTASYSSLGTCLCSSALPANVSLSPTSDPLAQLTYTYVKESWLYLGDNDMSWGDSQAFCLYLGYKLMEIYSQDENDFVMKYLIEQGQGNVWIGANDKVEENKFVWNDETTEMSYKHFRSPEQPNGGSNANCVSFSSSEGYWNDKNCNDITRKPLCRKG